MVDKTKTVVRIGGREYTIRSVESEEYIHKVAIYVDKKMEEIRQRQPNLSTTMLAMLTAINLADEVIKLQERVEKLQREISVLHSVLEEDGRNDIPNSSGVYDVLRRARR
ncbi:cell division protein ZapA [Caldicoprobacter guelmensis]|uniref:cell division protein ZapA n=1 Tax=Caldicoprobacter guelmensis TaxID=1170224 RepID=UPI001957BBE8|nr:cell division protein ZapA [Caldicoprobacter guelmensis]MBM7582053.1 cell division protein ZapA [Caldicoprobacter guelmensis]